MINKYSTLIAFSLLLTLGACRKKIAGIGVVDDSNTLAVKQVDFDYFSGKAKINYKDSELDIKAKANVRMKKDSVIWIAFSAVGIQGARCLINKDSVTIVNLFKKEYYVYEYDYLCKQFNIKI